MSYFLYQLGCCIYLFHTNVEAFLEPTLATELPGHLSDLAAVIERTIVFLETTFVSNRYQLMAFYLRRVSRHSS